MGLSNLVKSHIVFICEKYFSLELQYLKSSTATGEFVACFSSEFSWLYLCKMDREKDSANQTFGHSLTHFSFFKLAVLQLPIAVAKPDTWIVIRLIVNSEDVFVFLFTVHSIFTFSVY